MPYDKDDCAEALKEAAEILGKSPTSREYRQLDISPSYPTIQNKFDCWNDAKKYANLDTIEALQDRPPLHDFETYERWQHNDGEKQHTVLVHRLLAVAKYGFEEVKDKDVHHVNGCKIDNRPENVEVLTPTEHSQLHYEELADKLIGKQVQG